MSRDVRWAARYQFLDELWRGRARVLADPQLEHVLATGGPGFGADDPEPLRELGQALLPERPGSAPAWCTVAQVDAEGMQRRRPGTHFVTPAALAQLLARRRWDVAIVAAAHLEGEGGDEVRAVLRRGLGEGARAVVLVVPGPSADGLAYEDLVEVVGDLASEQTPGRVYGVFDEQVFGVVEYGEPIAVSSEEEYGEEYGDEEDDGDDGDDGEGDEDEGGDGEAYADEYGDEEGEVPLTYDNVLGVEDPPLREWLVVFAGERVPFAAEGLTLVEVFDPAEVTGDGAARPRGDRAELEAQLEQARRRADLAEIQRRQLMERQNELRRENARLLESLDALRRQEAGAGPAPEAAAREQELRLRLEQAEAELRRLRPRPVSKLEAELAELQARLAADETPAAQQAPSNEPPPPTRAPSRSPEVAPRAVSVTPAGGWGAHALMRRLGELITRVERDPHLRAGELRRALEELRASLRRRR